MKKIIIACAIGMLVLLGIGGAYLFVTGTPDTADELQDAQNTQTNQQNISKNTNVNEGVSGSGSGSVGNSNNNSDDTSAGFSDGDNTNANGSGNSTQSTSLPTAVYANDLVSDLCDGDESINLDNVAEYIPATYNSADNLLVAIKSNHNESVLSGSKYRDAEIVSQDKLNNAMYDHYKMVVKAWAYDMHAHEVGIVIPDQEILLDVEAAYDNQGKLVFLKIVPQNIKSYSM